MTGEESGGAEDEGQERRQETCRTDDEFRQEADDLTLAEVIDGRRKKQDGKDDRDNQDNGGTKDASGPGNGGAEDCYDVRYGERCEAASKDKRAGLFIQEHRYRHRGDRKERDDLRPHLPFDGLEVNDQTEQVNRKRKQHDHPVILRIVQFFLHFRNGLQKAFFGHVWSPSINCKKWRSTPCESVKSRLVLFSLKITSGRRFVNDFRGYRRSKHTNTFIHLNC